MGIFSKKTSFLGVDLGSTSIKVVELKKEKGVPTLVTYGYLEKAGGDIIRGKPKEVQAKTAEMLKKICQRAGVTTDQAVTALPNFSVFSSIITLPILPPKDLKEAIFWKAKKILPLPLEELSLEWKILEKVIVEKKEPTENGGLASTKKKENYRILIVAASKNLVNQYIEIFRQANFQLKGLETEAFALSRALIGKDPGTTMIIDTSAVSTDIIIVEKMIPVFNRSIDIGGVVLTKTIAQSLNISFERAEQFKRDFGLSRRAPIPSLIEKTIRPVIDEIRYSTNLFHSQTGKEIEKIILSGGSSFLKNFPDYLSQELGMKVLVSNPWKRVAYPQELEPALNEIAPRFAVAIGLALREII
ncbi:MAG: type IV pilus assembly protein PilM [Patescibacteria group bacterium]|nr:type IV pilus assembly protein PilM [Patescibacteria group bacterium]